MNIGHWCAHVHACCSTGEGPVGADVYTADGDRIGFVVSGNAYELDVGDGFLFMNVYTVPIAWVERYEEGHLILWMTAEQFEAAIAL